MNRFLICAASLLALAACSNVTAPQTVADACLTADRLLRAAIILDQANKLTPNQVNLVSVSGSTINGFCSQASPPTDIAGALAGINGAVQSLTTIPGVQ